MIAALIMVLAIRTFYISPSGDDNADGRSQAKAWRTLDRASNEWLEPGDEIILESGATFEGNLVLKHGGTANHPIVVRSKGSPATIHSPSAPAITIRTGGIELRDLILRGGATAKGDKKEGLLLVAPADRRSRHVRIEHLDISGFGGAGIAIQAEKASLNGFEDVRISHSVVHGNYGTGIVAGDDVSYLGKGYAHSGLFVTDCDVSNNFEGNGIIISGFDGATVEYCRTSGNQSAEGALGMWCWSAKHVVFRYCIANGTRGKGDAGGYDIDGGSVECKVENCLSYDNDGPGYMHCDYPDAPRTHHNEIRKSISIDDGRKAKGEPFGFGFVVWGTGLYDCIISDNVAVMTKSDPLDREFGGLFATFIRTPEVPLAKQRLERAIFQDNVVSISAKGSAFVQDNFPPSAFSDVSYIRNRYQSTLYPPFVKSVDGKKAVSTYELWRLTHKKDFSPRHQFKDKWLKGYKQLKPRDLPNFFKHLATLESRSDTE